MLNWELMKNPLNWIIIILMLLIAALAGHYIIQFFNQTRAITKTQESTEQN